MRISKIIALAAIVTLLPFCSFALDIGSKIQFSAQLLSFFNLVLFITSLISIKQFFWTSDDNKMPFHVFNFVFAVIFYSISLPFLITNKMYYEEYQDLVPFSVIGKFFLSLNISSFAQWLIVASMIINLLYIKRYYSDYFQAGIADTNKEGKQAPLENDSAPIEKPENDLSLAIAIDEDASSVSLEK